MLVVKKKSIFAVTGRETMNVNAKQLICKFCGIMIFFLFIFDKFWFPRLWLFLAILDISFLLVHFNYKSKFNVTPYRSTSFLAAGSAGTYLLYALNKNSDGYILAWYTFWNELCDKDFGALSAYHVFLLIMGVIAIVFFVYFACTGRKNIISRIVKAIKTLTKRVFHEKTEKEKEKNEGDLYLGGIFSERKQDIERLGKLLQHNNVVGVTSEWGNGKTFMVDRFCENSQNEYYIIKIHVLAYKYGEIDTVLIDQISQFLASEGVYSSASSAFKRLWKNSYISTLKYALLGGWANEEKQSDIFFTLSADIKKTGKKVLVIFEDLERVSNAEDVKRVWAIVNEIESEYFKVIYEYDKTGFDRLNLGADYREKFIPVEMSLSKVTYRTMAEQLMMDLNMNQELNDIKISEESFVSSAKSAFISPAAYIESGGCLPIYRGLFQGANSLENHVTARKVKNFLLEVKPFLSENKKMDKNQFHTALAFYVLKYFYYECYEKLQQKVALSELPLFYWNGEQVSYELYTGVLASGGVNKENGNEIAKNVKAQWILNVFKYTDYPGYNNTGKNRPYHEKFAKEKEYQCKIDHMIWHLLGSGIDMDTDYKFWLDSFDSEVLQAAPGKGSLQKWSSFENKIYGTHGESGRQSLLLYEDNLMLGLADTYYLYDKSSQDWEIFLTFFISIGYLSEMGTLLLRVLSIALKTKDKSDLLIKKCLSIFNQAKIVGHLNDKEEYYLFITGFIECVTKGMNSEEKKEKLSQIPRKLYVLKSGQVKERVAVLEEARKIFQELDNADWRYKDYVKEIDPFIDKNEELIRYPNRVLY